MGDRAITGRNETSLAGLETIDASSKKSAAYSEERTVAGARVFLTPEGAAKLDAERENKQWSVNVNGHTWERIKAFVAELKAGK